MHVFLGENKYISQFSCSISWLQTHFIALRSSCPSCPYILSAGIESIRHLKWYLFLLLTPESYHLFYIKKFSNTKIILWIILWYIYILRWLLFKTIKVCLGEEKYVISSIFKAVILLELVFTSLCGEFFAKYYLFYYWKYISL